MGSKLEVPLQLSAIRIQSKNTIGIKIISGPWLANEIGRWIAGRPKQCIQLRIECSRHPGCTAAVEIGVAEPTGRTEFTRRRNRPEFPFELSGCSVIRRQKSAHA